MRQRTTRASKAAGVQARARKGSCSASSLVARRATRDCRQELGARKGQRDARPRLPLSRRRRSSSTSPGSSLRDSLSAATAHPSAKAYARRCCRESERPGTAAAPRRRRRRPAACFHGQRLHSKTVFTAGPSAVAVAARQHRRVADTARCLPRWPP